VIGAGVAPITQVLRILVAGGFDGWISIEEASRTGEEGFRRAVTFVDRAWQEAGGWPRRVRYERTRPHAVVADAPERMASPPANNVDERLEHLSEIVDRGSVGKEGRTHVRPTQLRTD